MGNLKQDAMGRGLVPCSVCGQLTEDVAPLSEPICPPCVWAEHDQGERDEQARDAEQERHESAAEEHYGMSQADFYAQDREPF